MFIEFPFEMQTWNSKQNKSFLSSNRQAFSKYGTQFYHSAHHQEDP